MKTQVSPQTWTCLRRSALAMHQPHAGQETRFRCVGAVKGPAATRRSTWCAPSRMPSCTLSQAFRTPVRLCSKHRVQHGNSAQLTKTRTKEGATRTLHSSGSGSSESGQRAPRRGALGALYLSLKHRPGTLTWLDFLKSPSAAKDAGTLGSASCDSSSGGFWCTYLGEA